MLCFLFQDPVTEFGDYFFLFFKTKNVKNKFLQNQRKNTVTKNQIDSSKKSKMKDFNKKFILILIFSLFERNPIKKVRKNRNPSPFSTNFLFCKKRKILKTIIINKFNYNFIIFSTTKLKI